MTLRYGATRHDGVRKFPCSTLTVAPVFICGTALPTLFDLEVLQLIIMIRVDLNEGCFAGIFQYFPEISVFLVFFLLENTELSGNYWKKLQNTPRCDSVSSRRGSEKYPRGALSLTQPGLVSHAENSRVMYTAVDFVFTW